MPNAYLRIFILLYITRCGQFDATQAQCDNDQCNLGRDDQLNIHFIAHTHDDVGWTQTVQEYYDSSVRSILDTSISTLLENETYRFTYVEMAFFHKWFAQQSTFLQSKVRELIRTGRPEFALGGWVSSDEAVVFYGDEVDQLTIGRDFIRRNFGSCSLPRVAWQVDAFGHARERAQVFLEAGFDSLYFQRMDYVEKDARKNNGELEFLWDSSPKEKGVNENYSGLFSKLFTHVFYDTYCFTEGGCMDEGCGYEDQFDRVPTWKVNLYVQTLELWHKAYQTNHIMVPMGCDFTYTNAKTNFRLMDILTEKLSKLRVGNLSLNVFYSTPACYTKAVNREFFKMNNNLPQRTGDFFPYASSLHTYWTGFYTSRPAFKYFVRLHSLLLTIAEQLNVIVPRNAFGERIEQLRQQVAIVQHHDAVSGTEQQHVTDDYVWRLNNAALPCKEFIGQAIGLLQVNEITTSSPWNAPTFCNQRNISLCSVTDRKELDNPSSFRITLYNPLGWEIPDIWLRVPIHFGSYSTQVRVTDLSNPDSCKIIHQLVEVTDRTRSIPERQIARSSTDMDLVFRSVPECAVPALGFRTYQVDVAPNIGSKFNDLELESGINSNARMLFKLSAIKTGVQIKATHSGSGKEFAVNVEMMYYKGSTSSSPSGAYIFHPEKEAIGWTDAETEIEDGPCVQELQVTYYEWATMVVRHYNDERLEIEWTVGPIPDNYGTESREVIIRYSVVGDTPELRPATKGEFFTDSSGRRLIRRLRTSNLQDPIASNYYPVINRILIKGAGETSPGNFESKSPPLALAVYTDRPQGGSSLEEGQLELMLHRRLIRDDRLGVNEALMEQGVDNRGSVVRGVHWLVLDETAEVEQADRYRAMLVTKPPIPLFDEVTTSSSGDSISRTQWTALKKPLPKNIHLLSLIRWPLTQNNSSSLKKILLRLENLESAEGREQQVTELDIGQMFHGIVILDATEMTLTADQSKTMSDKGRLVWRQGEKRSSGRQCVDERQNRPTLIRLYPDTICTLVCNVELSVSPAF
ncbi:lysosomal alpha-mannosidase [Clonorchis sinensis]|uniref:Alpha-mannosidase n=1 Tax=Clonorchis sinensis TaxID=79923 RepID=G7YAW4_CLOSI|nr:lysosomal alpha-mannosidase [Clonorchis sinensis]